MHDVLFYEVVDNYGERRTPLRAEPPLPLFPVFRFLFVPLMHAQRGILRLRLGTIFRHSPYYASPGSVCPHLERGRPQWEARDDDNTTAAATAHRIRTC